METPDLIAGFAAGFLSFLSPCVLPLVPSYLSFISGEASSDIRSGSADRGLLLSRTLFFALGFTSVFMAMGFLIAGIAGTSNGVDTALRTVGGIVIVVLGLNLIFDFIKILNREARFHVTKKATSHMGAFLFGAAFGAGWSPCIGPILGSILFLAGSGGSTATAALLLGVYSVGFSLPFFAMAFFFRAFTPLWDFLKRHGNSVRVVSGLFLIFMGIFMLSGRLQGLTSDILGFGFALSDAYNANPLPFRIGGCVLWALASLLAFFLPLVPRYKFPSVRRIAVASAFAILSALEGFGIVSTAGIVVSWLTWSLG